MSQLIAAVAVCCAALLLGARPRAALDPRIVWVPTAMLAGAILIAVGVGSGLRLPLLGVLAVAGWATYRYLRSRRARVEQDRRAAIVIEVCEGIAADLRAGQPSLLALEAAAREWPEFRMVADAGRLGSDVPSALRRLGREPGARGLEAVAAAWVIAHSSGAGLADAIALSARAIREERATARIIETELASARATARLLAVLPVGVLLIGRGTGGDPFGFLLGTTPGMVCLGAGLLLSWAGLAWLERIDRSVQG